MEEQVDPARKGEAVAGRVALCGLDEARLKVNFGPRLI